MAAKGIREHDADGRIVVVGADPHPVYKRPLLTKGLWTGAPEEKLWREPAAGADVVTGRRIVSLDLDAHTRDRRRRRGVRVGEAPPRDRRAAARDSRRGRRRLVPDARRLPRSCARRRPRARASSSSAAGSSAPRSRPRSSAPACSVTMVFPEPGIGFRLFPTGLAEFLVGLLPREGRRGARRRDGQRRVGDERDARRRARPRGGLRRRRARRHPRDRPRGGSRARGRRRDRRRRVRPRERARRRLRRRRRRALPRRRARHVDARRARGSREHARQGRRREHGRRRAAVRPPAVLLLRPLRPRLRGRRRRSTRGSRRSRTGRSRTARASSRTSRTASRAACCSGTSGTRSTTRASSSAPARAPLRSDALARSRKRRNGYEILCEAVFRPLAHPLVLVLARLRVPPPAVVVAAGAAGIAAAVELGRGSLLIAAALDPAEDAPRQRRRPARAADGPDERVRPLPRLRGRPPRQRRAVRGGRLAARAARRSRLVGFVALTSVLSLNFNAERLSRAAPAEPETTQVTRCHDVSCAGLRRRLRAAGPARGVDRRAAARAHVGASGCRVLANLGMSTQLAVLGVFLVSRRSRSASPGSRSARSRSLPSLCSRSARPVEEIA